MRRMLPVPLARGFGSVVAVPGFLAVRFLRFLGTGATGSAGSGSGGGGGRSTVANAVPLCRRRVCVAPAVVLRTW